MLPSHPPRAVSASSYRKDFTTQNRHFMLNAYVCYGLIFTATGISLNANFLQNATKGAFVMAPHTCMYGTGNAGLERNLRTDTIFCL